MVNRLDGMVIAMKNQMYRFWNDEKGDTNFISMLVILGIALALAGVFLQYKELVLTWVNTNIGSFFTTNAGGTVPGIGEH